MSINWLNFFYYDESSKTKLRHAATRYKGKGGNIVAVAVHEEAGCMSNGGYFRVRYKGKQYLAHRIVWELLNGAIPDTQQIDHIDRDKSNNSANNLRIVDKIINLRNKCKYTNNSSGVTCVYKSRNKAKGIDYFVAVWKSANNSRHRKYFNINALGENEAYQQAVEFRERKLTEMQKLLGYTCLHGL